MRNLLIVCFTLFLIHIARSEETPFTYQGRLADGGMPANGVYDLTFGLYSTNVGGVPLSVSITNTLSVTNGLFSTTLDFGSVFDGSAYWLELGVRTNGCGDFTILSPRSKVHPVPYAQHAESAANFTGMVSDNQISNSVPRLNKPVNNFSGTVTAATFIGSGSQVTNIPASSITGSPWLRNSSNLGDVSSKYAAAGQSHPG